MTGISSERRARWGLVGIALVAFALRVFPFFGADGAWSYRVDYDEGVYFSAASHLLQGAWPYRDFVFVHPPGVLVYLALTSAWTSSFLGVAGAFALSRWLAALIGVLNVLLVGRLVQRLSGHHAAALFAAALYAVYPEVVQVERGPFLEPVLNLVCLGMTLCLHRASEEGSTYRPAWVLIAGVLGGLALSIKVWAASWLLAAVGGLWLLGERRVFVTFFVAVLVTASALVLPFALRAPGEFLTQAGLFHLWRPPDGLASRVDRLEQLVALRHLASPLLALFFLDVALRRRAPATVIDRMALIAWVLTVAGFLASSAYWSQYNAHLIASEAVLAGAALAFLWRDGPSRLRALANVGLAVLVLVSLGLSVFHVFRRAQSTDEHLRLARSELAKTDACVFAFEPGWLLAANRLPPSGLSEPVPSSPRDRPAQRILIDSYASQLLEARASGARFPTTAAAFASVPTVPAALQHCRFVILGDRGRRQLSPQALEAFERTHRRTETAALEVWEPL